MKKPRLTYANVMSTLAFFLALGGASYAAVSIPANSVGTRQIVDKSVGTSDLADRAVSSSKLVPSVLTSFKGQKGDAGPRGPAGAGLLAISRNPYNYDVENEPPGEANWIPIGSPASVEVPSAAPALYVYAGVHVKVECGDNAGKPVENVVLRLLLRSPSGREFATPDSAFQIPSWPGHVANNFYSPFSVVSPSATYADGYTSTAPRVSIGLPEKGTWTAATEVKRPLVGCYGGYFARFSNSTIWASLAPLRNEALSQKFDFQG